MEFRFSEYRISDMVTELRHSFSESEVREGMAALEKLINIKTDDADGFFEEKCGEYINDHDIDKKWDIEDGCRIEGFLKKITAIRKMAGRNYNPADGDYKTQTLWPLYERNGFREWEQDGKFQEAVAKDCKQEGNFDISRVSSAYVYKSCNNHIMDYIIVYRMRNSAVHANEMAQGAEDTKTHAERIQSLYTVYIHQCLLNKQDIDSVYEKYVFGTMVDPVKYAKKKIEKLVLDRFQELIWMDGSDRYLFDQTMKSLKFVGEPGMGKTTQMRELYRRRLKLAAAGKEKKLPVWIDLSVFSRSTNDIAWHISKELGDYGQYYTLLMEKGYVELFLDGYNEVLRDDKDPIKRQLALDIDMIHKKYSGVIITLTDRVKRAKLPVLTDVSCYVLKPFTKADMISYVTEKNAGDEVIDYIKEATWLDYSDNAKEMLPEKLNCLIELVKAGKKPADEDVFHGFYLKYLLDREADEKKEARIGELKYYLRDLAIEMNDCTEYIGEADILDIWEKASGSHQEREKTRGELSELLNLVIQLGILKSNEEDEDELFVRYRFANKGYYSKLFGRA